VRRHFCFFPLFHHWVYTLRFF